MRKLLIRILCDDVSAKYFALGGPGGSFRLRDADFQRRIRLPNTRSPVASHLSISSALHREPATDISLSEKTRVKLLRKGTVYSFVQLEDSRTGYVANKNMAVAPPESQKKPFGSTGDEAPTKPRRKKRVRRPPATPSPSPVSQGEQLKDTPSHDVKAPIAHTSPRSPKSAPRRSPPHSDTDTASSPGEAKVPALNR